MADALTIAGIILSLIILVVLAVIVYFSINTLNDSLNTAITAAGALIRGGGDVVSSVINTAIDEISVVTATITTAYETIRSDIASAFNKFYADLQTFTTVILNQLGVLLNQVIAGLSTLGQQLGQGISI